MDTPKQGVSMSDTDTCPARVGHVLTVSDASQRVWLVGHGETLSRTRQNRVSDTARV